MSKKLAQEIKPRWSSKNYRQISGGSLSGPVITTAARIEYGADQEDLRIVARLVGLREKFPYFQEVYGDGFCSINAAIGGFLMHCIGLDDRMRDFQYQEFRNNIRTASGQRGAIALPEKILNHQGVFDLMAGDEIKRLIRAVVKEEYVGKIRSLVGWINDPSLVFSLENSSKDPNRSPFEIDESGMLILAKSRKLVCGEDPAKNQLAGKLFESFAVKHRGVGAINTMEKDESLAVCTKILPADIQVNIIESGAESDAVLQKNTIYLCQDVGNHYNILYPNSETFLHNKFCQSLGIKSDHHDAELAQELQRWERSAPAVSLGGGLQNNSATNLAGVTPASVVNGVVSPAVSSPLIFNGDRVVNSSPELEDAASKKAEILRKSRITTSSESAEGKKSDSDHDDVVPLRPSPTAVVDGTNLVLAESKDANKDVSIAAKPTTKKLNRPSSAANAPKTKSNESSATKVVSSNSKCTIM